ncbi:nucleoside hydrolase [Westerdykella ornata]|uniref:Nucleoside hydrolase n=1 Tax=Westerdykella ornata TaxID=318751 RepID=A0A6A6J875_WESOR|nr:nucleoside hydrolase [Westerdykella ornata]KAF2271409.1 nucleoside hydrolase [Westerdykella ornata]
MAPNRIIIDTDPGVDDVLAMLLAFSAKPEELEVLMVSVQFGNVDVQNCLRNVISLFQHVDNELAWRRENGRPEGFEALKARKPIVAVGAEEPLAEHLFVADFFHGIDGLGGIHHSHPHLTPKETWKSLFQPAPQNMTPEQAAELRAVEEEHSLFTPSLQPAHLEILRLLRENEPDTITIVAIGPLTNLATAAATDPECFLRAKEVVVMGGAIDVPGNPPNLALLHSPTSPIQHIPVPPFHLTKQPDTPLRRALNVRNQITPGAEFNVFADSVAAARVFALTSPHPKTTMPPVLHGKKKWLGEYPEALSKRLRVKMFPLDITSHHLLPRTLFHTHTSSPSLLTSPLSNWSKLFLNPTFDKILSLSQCPDPDRVALELHDPLTIYYVLTSDDPGWKFTQDEDVRIETAGQWTRGVCVVDRRGKVVRDVSGDEDGDVMDEVPGDAGGWLDARRGNRVMRCTGSPDQRGFGGWFLRRVFGEVRRG